MKTRLVLCSKLIAIALAFVFTAPSLAQQQSMALVGRTDDGEYYFVYPSSRSMTGGLARVTTAIIPGKPTRYKAGKLIRYTKYRVEANCTARTVRMYSYEYFDATGRSLAVRVTNDKFQIPVPRSLEDFDLNFACYGTLKPGARSFSGIGAAIHHADRTG